MPITLHRPSRSVAHALTSPFGVEFFAFAVRRDAQNLSAVDAAHVEASRRRVVRDALGDEPRLVNREGWDAVADGRPVLLKEREDVCELARGAERGGGFVPVGGVGGG